MATIHWANPVSADFNTASDWAGGVVPGKGDVAALDAAGGIFTVTISATDEILKGLQLASNASLAVDHGYILHVGGAVVNSGAVVLDGGLEARGNGATFSGGGNIDIGGDGLLSLGATGLSKNVDNTISGAGQIDLQNTVNESLGVINATGSLTLRSGYATVNYGLIEASAGGTLNLAVGTIDQSGGGSITANNGSTVLLNFAEIIGGTVESVGSGALEVDVAAHLLGGSSALTIAGRVEVSNGDQLTIIGAIHNTGQISLNPGSSSLFANGATLTGGGQVIMHNSKDVVSGGSLTNVDNHISGGGLLGNANMALINEAEGTILSDARDTLVIDTGAVTIVNAGHIVANAGGGLIVKSPLQNTGALRAVGGKLVLNGAVTGSGSAQIDGGTLIVRGAFTENVKFIGPTGVFELATWRGYTGAISGLSTSGSNSIDLLGMAFGAGSKASYSGTTAAGILTVTNGTRTASLHLKGNYLGSTFTVSDDGADGTRVIDPAAAPASSAAPLTQAMATFAAGGAGEAHVQTPPPRMAWSALARPA
jgi:hypothetical protein